MNKDLIQVNRFNGFGNKILHNWVEDINGLSPEDAYIQITSFGKKSGEVVNLKELDNLLLKKSSRDCMKNMWTEDLANGNLSVLELIEDDFEDIAFQCMKDIVKTTDRIIIMSDNNSHSVEFENRNWFIDKLNLKFPKDICPCYQCKETFWKTREYIKDVITTRETNKTKLYRF